MLQADQKSRSSKRSIVQFSADLTAIGILELEGAAGLHRAAAEASMKRIVDQLCSAYARCTIYVPQTYDLRNRTMFDKYHRQGRAARPCTADRIHELADEFSLTSRRIYEILDQCRAEGMQPSERAWHGQTVVGG